MSFQRVGLIAAPTKKSGIMAACMCVAPPNVVLVQNGGARVH